MEVWVQFFKDGFFGYGEPGDFTYFSLAHLVPLAVLVLAVWLVWHYRDRLPPSVIMTTGPSYYRYYQFWLEHMLPVISVLYMTFVHGFRPTVRGIPFTLGILSVLTALSLICNANIEGANYLFLAAGTADGGGSPMDFLIKIASALWSRVVILFALAIALFFAIYGIFAGLQKLADRRAAQRQTACRENS